MKVNLIGISPYSLKSAGAHSHNCWEIVLNLEGEGTTVIGSKELSFYPGSIICQPPNTKHSKFAKDKFKDIFVQVSNFALAPENSVPVFTDDEEKTFETLMFLALRIFHKKDPNDISVVDSLYNSMYELLLSWSDGRQKNKTVELFKNNLIENFTNPEFQIAGAMKKNTYCDDHFRRCFKKETGMTPVSYLKNLRIEYSKKLLKQKGENIMAISDIAFSSGFYDYHYFSRVFKAAVGMTPKDYRSKQD